MHYRRITELAVTDGLIEPRGLTPEASTNAAITQDIKRRALTHREQRFRAYGRGMYGLETPVDVLGGAIGEHNRQARDKLRSVLAVMDPRQFEVLIGALLIALGFDEVEVTRYSSDGGIDVRAVLSVGGMTEVRTAIQVKRWSNSVTGRTVRELRGGLGPHERGLIITLSDFTRDARREAVESDRSPITLINGENLLDFLIDNEIGVVRRSVMILQLDEASLSEQLPEDPDHEDATMAAPRPMPILRTEKSLSVWPLPGGGSSWKDTLDRMISYVASNAPTMSASIAWLIDSYDRVKSEKVARGYWHVLRSFGLIESDGEQLLLTDDGSRYLADSSQEILFDQLKTQVAGIGEIVSYVAIKPASFEEIRTHLNETLGTRWETDAQVRFRLGWLELLGVTRISNGVASLVESL